MNVLLRMYPGDAWAFLIANVLVQVTVVVLMAWLLARLGSRWNAAWRHSIYMVALICVLASPALSWIMQASGFPSILNHGVRRICANCAANSQRLDRQRAKSIRGEPGLDSAGLRDHAMSCLGQGFLGCESCIAKGVLHVDLAGDAFQAQIGPRERSCEIAVNILARYDTHRQWSHQSSDAPQSGNVGCAWGDPGESISQGRQKSNATVNCA